MKSNSTLKAILVALAMTAAAAQAQAETEFSTLAGIEAEPMSAIDMERTQGKCGDLGCFDWQGQFYAPIAGQLGIPPGPVDSYYGIYGPVVTDIWTNGSDPFSQYLATMQLIYGMF